MSEALRNNVKRMLEAGVPEDKIKQYIQKFGAAQPQPPAQQPQPPAQQPQPSAQQGTQQYGPMHGVEPDKPLTGVTDPMAEWGKLPGRIIPSAVETVKETAGALAHPVETAKGLAGLVKGGIETLAADPFDPQTPEQEMFRGVMKGVKEKYGSMEGLKKDIIRDPIGNLVNVASLFMAGGAGLKAAKFAKAGDIMLKTGAALDPITGTAAAIKLPMSKIADPLARKLYNSAAKFSTTLNAEEKARLVNTGLKHGIKVSKEGLGKLAAKRDAVGKAIADSIDAATKAGEAIKITDLLQPISEVIDQAGRGASPIKGHMVAKNVRREMLKQWVVKEGKVKLTPKRVQELKQSIYRELEPHYKNPKPNSPYVVQTKKAVARAAKESLEDIIPGIKKLNKNASELIELDKALERSVSRISNRDLMSLTTSIGGFGAVGAGAAGGAEAAVGAAMAALAIGILKAPKVASQIALIAHKYSKKGVQIKPTRAAIRLGLLKLDRPRYADGKNITLTEKDFEGSEDD